MNARKTELEPGTLRFSLLNDYQRGFPLEQRPYEAIASELGVNEATIIATYRELLASGSVSRIGVVLRPGVLGASALVALAVPPSRLEAIAAIVDRHDEVSHDYEREHELNLWFVVSAADRDRLAAIVAGIERETGLAPVVLPLIEEYHIDLGFDLAKERGGSITRASGAPTAGGFADAGDIALARALQSGLALEPTPYASLAARAGMTERAALERIERWLLEGAARRFGVVVRHWQLGFRANAMAVWDVPDPLVGEVGRALAGEPMVTLAYRRARALPRWRHNVFAMIHGTDRGTVESTIARISARHGLDRFAHAVLFSRRCFKQRGARFRDTALGG